MKSTFILGVFLLLLVMMLLAMCKEEPRTIKSSDIKDGTITEPKMVPCDVEGITSDIETWRILRLRYKGKLFVPIEEHDSLIKENGLYRDSLQQIMIECPKIIYNAWATGYATAWTHKYDNTRFNEQRKKDSILFIKDVLQ